MIDFLFNCALYVIAFILFVPGLKYVVLGVPLILFLNSCLDGLTSDIAKKTADELKKKEDENK
jgi:hypothetical protein